ncbi:MAG: DUF5723 family protein [Bacteroidia bacterium]|nr:DUF5723 family protein [Bacteroidia bacterium]MDW8345618.1 DUF5723 family protein [Bacteroidia bacterium]
MYACFFAQAQSQLMFFNKGISAAYIPAMYPQLDIDKAQFNTGLRLSMGNNNFSYGIVDKLLKGQTITYEETKKMSDKSKKRNVIASEYSLHLIDAVMKKNNYFIGFGVEENDFLSFSYNRDLGKLLWQGNSQFEGKTVKDDKTKFYWHRIRHYKLTGAAQINEKLSMGGSIKFVQGIRHIRTKHFSGSLYTAKDGEYLNFTMDYEFNTAGLGRGNTGTFKFNGLGAGIDLNLAYQLNQDKQQVIYVYLHNLGFVAWNGNPVTYTESTSQFRFEGQNIPNLFAVQNNNNSGFDTLRKVFSSRLSTQKYTDALPMRLGVGYTQVINENLHISGLVEQGYHSSITFRPHVTSAVQYTINEYFAAGGCMGLLGFNNFNLGLHARFTYRKFGIWLSSDQITGIVIPRIGTGVAFHGGIWYKI